jgi:hypothetical protein
MPVPPRRSRQSLTDAKIHIYGYEMPAHSIVLAAQSDYFDRALDSKMKEGQTRSICFEEGSAHAYWRVFEYMYTGAYREEPGLSLEMEGTYKGIASVSNTDVWSY